jgi:HSP20 family protein
MDEKNIEVKIANVKLTIKGEKPEEKEEEKQDYYVRERSFGSFERTFPVPDGVDIHNVDASFKKGVLSVMLPKTAEAQKPEKKVSGLSESFVDRHGLAICYAFGLDHHYEGK